MPNVPASSVERELTRGERLLWKGRPQSGIKLRPSDAFLIPFSLFWGGFAIIWEYLALTQTPKNDPIGFIFPLFGVPFVLIGLYLMFGRFVLDAKYRERTEYAVTNQRAIIVSGLLARKVRSINIRSIPDISVTERPDKSGTITFGESTLPYAWWFQAGFWMPGMPSPQPSAFEMIENVRSVYTLVQNARTD